MVQNKDAAFPGWIGGILIALFCKERVGFN